MSQSIRNDETRTSLVITPERDGGFRIEEGEAEAAPPTLSYGGYLRVLGGRGTVCLPLSATAEIPHPGGATAAFHGKVVDTGGLKAPITNLVINEPDYEKHFGLSQGLNCELIPPEEIKSMWDQVVADSTRQVTKQTSDQARQSEEGKTRKLEMLLRLALNSGNMELAILLFSGLESRKANEVSASLMQRMQQLQDERRKLSSQMAPSGDQAKDAQNAQGVNAKMGDISTEMNLLQTLLQDIQARKNEAQQMASNFIKSRHDTGMGIIRNMT